MTGMPKHPCSTDRINRPALMTDWTCPVCLELWQYGEVDPITHQYGWTRKEPAHV